MDSLNSKINKNVKMSLQDIEKYLKAKLVIKNNSIVKDITNISPLELASENSISFYTNNLYKQQLLVTNASVVITSEKFVDLVPCNVLVVSNPHYAYALLLKHFYNRTISSSSVHETVIIGNNCKISDSAYIGPYVVLGDNVIVEDNVYISSSCTIGNNCRLASGSYLYPRVVLYSDINIGSDCIIHSGAVIGADGFGFALTENKSWYKVEQLGGVTIGNDVEIGANTTIDCGALVNTIISDGVKLDNQIQIGHNVHMGDHSIAAAKFAVAGSTKIGKHCAFGGASIVAGHLNIANGVSLAGASVMAKSIEKPGVYASGTGTAMPFKKWRRMSVSLEQLDTYMSKFKKLFKATEND